MASMILKIVVLKIDAQWDIWLTHVQSGEHPRAIAHFLGAQKYVSCFSQARDRIARPEWGQEYSLAQSGNIG